jgi:hypothetical protein
VRRLHRRVREGTVTRRRDPATEIRHLRWVLRRCLAALRAQADPAASPEFYRAFAEEAIRLLERALAPKRRRRETGR